MIVHSSRLKLSWPCAHIFSGKERSALTKWVECKSEPFEYSKARRSRLYIPHIAMPITYESVLVYCRISRFNAEAIQASGVLNL